MTDVSEILRLVKAQDQVLDKFDGRIKELQDEGMDLAKKITRAQFSGGGGGAPEAARDRWIDTKSGQTVEVLRPGDRLATKADDTPSLGRILRGIITGPHAPDARELAEERKGLLIGSDPAGGYAIEGAVAEQWVDALRAQSVLTSAGARTVVMPSGNFGIARIDTDPVVSWHGESANITATEPVFGRVNLVAKTAVAVIPFSIELSQDCANLEEQLAALVTRGMAAALDSAGLVGVTVGSAAAPTGLVNLSGRSTVTSIGAIADHDFLIDGLFELMNANASTQNAALVGNPSLWKSLAKLRTGITNDESPLPAPAEVAALRKFWTTAMPTTTAIVADWTDVIIGIRKSLTIKLVDSRLASNLDGTLVAYLRADVACVRPASLCTLENIA